MTGTKIRIWSIVITVALVIGAFTVGPRIAKLIDDRVVVKYEIIWDPGRTIIMLATLNGFPVTLNPQPQTSGKWTIPKVAYRGDAVKLVVDLVDVAERGPFKKVICNIYQNNNLMKGRELSNTTSSCIVEAIVN